MEILFIFSICVWFHCYPPMPFEFYLFHYVKQKKKISLRYGLWTISNYHYVKKKINICTFDFIKKTNIQYHYLEDITERLQSLGGISSTGDADKLTHLIWGFFLEEYAWLCNACTSDKSFVLLLFKSHVCD